MFNDSNQLLIVNEQNNSLMIIDSTTNNIEAQLKYDPHHIITGIYIIKNSPKVYFPCHTTTNSSLLYVLNLKLLSLYRLPIELPKIKLFSICSHTAYFTDDSNFFYAFDTATMSLIRWGQSTDDGHVIDLKASDDFVYTLWESNSCGYLVVFNTEGEIIDKQYLPGHPSSLLVGNDDTIIISFTDQNNALNLSLYKYNSQEDGVPLNIFSLTCPLCKSSIRGYPIGLTLNYPDLYLLCLENFILAIDLVTKKVKNYIPLNKSITCFEAVPLSSYLLALNSNEGELILIDTLKAKEVAVTDMPEKLGPFVLMPKFNV